MNVELMLPRPTEEELDLGSKADYFDRILELDLDKKYKISQQELTFWISKNYNSVFILDKELSLNEARKLI